MGLGKTLQTISLLSYLASYKGIWGPHLVVVPTSVIINWETELKRFCPALKVLCYYGSAKRRKELRTGWTQVCDKSIFLMIEDRESDKSVLDKLVPCCHHILSTCSPRCICLQEEKVVLLNS